MEPDLHEAVDQHISKISRSESTMPSALLQPSMEDEFVRQIVERNKGRISVESTVGKGTTFFLDFPAPRTSNPLEPAPPNFPSQRF